MSTKDKITAAANSVGEDATDIAKDIQSHAKDAWKSMGKQTNKAIKESKAYVRAHPVCTVLATLGVGLIIGMFLNRPRCCPRQSAREIAT